jgi:hypothetical protein
MKIRVVKTIPPIKVNNYWVYRVDDTIEIDLADFSIWHKKKWGKKEGTLIHCDSVQFSIAQFIESIENE